MTMRGKWSVKIQCQTIMLSLTSSSSDMEKREEREDLVEERRERPTMGVATRPFFSQLETGGVAGRGTLEEDATVCLADAGVEVFLVGGVFTLAAGVAGRELDTGVPRGVRDRDFLLGECNETFSLSFLDADDFGVPRDFLGCR